MSRQAHRGGLGMVRTARVRARSTRDAILWKSLDASASVPWASEDAHPAGLHGRNRSAVAGPNLDLTYECRKGPKASQRQYLVGAMRGDPFAEAASDFGHAVRHRTQVCRFFDPRSGSDRGFAAIEWSVAGSRRSGHAQARSQSGLPVVVRRGAVALRVAWPRGSAVPTSSGSRPSMGLAEIWGGRACASGRRPQACGRRSCAARLPPVARRPPAGGGARSR